VRSLIKAGVKKRSKMTMLFRLNIGELDAVVLSAWLHLDHSASPAKIKLPMGYKGPIYYVRTQTARLLE